MLTLKTLTFSGIGRFVEEQEIDFTELANLVQVDGLNKNTGGSSAAGKSTVFNALDFLLGLNEIPNSILQSRVTTKGISVAGVFDWDGKIIRIVRNKKGLSIEQEGQNAIVGSTKIAEEKLDEIIAIPRELFRRILHKRQGDRGFFLNLTPKDVHEFLTDALNLEESQSKLDHVDDIIKVETTSLVSLESQLKIHEASLAATKNARESMGVIPSITILQEDLIPLKAVADQAKTELALMTQKHLAETGAHEALRPKVTMQPFDRTRLQELNQKVADIGQKAQQLGVSETARQQEVTRQILLLKTDKERAINLINFGVKANTDAKTVAEEVKVLRSCICPTCKQGWNTEATKAKEAELIEKLKGFAATVNAGKLAEQKRDEIIAQIATLEPQMKAIKIEGLAELLMEKEGLANAIKLESELEREHQTAELTKSQNAINEWSVNGQAIVFRQSADITIVRKLAYEAGEQYRAAEAKFASETQAVERYNTQYYLHTKNLERWETAFAETNAKIIDLKERLELLEDSKKAIKSFMSCSFEEALQFIGDAATNLIRNIPNMANATITIEGTKETAKGAVKEEVNAVLNVDGEESVPLRSLSGGERTSVDIAIDLAVIDLIQTRTNKGINIFVLDEPFTGLESINIEPILELLRSSNIGKKLFIVDHNPIIKEAIQDRILVVREGAISSLNN